MEDFVSQILAWPPLGLRIRTQRLELRLPICADVAKLAPISYYARTGPRIGITFTPTELLTREIARSIAEWSVDQWTLTFGAFQANGHAVGIQSVNTKEFSTSRVFRTPVWVAPSNRRQGYATEMREAVLSLMFDHLGAVAALASPRRDNTASIIVSTALGYVPFLETGEATSRKTLPLRLTRDGWLGRCRPEVLIDGIADCLPLFGLA